MTRFTLHVPELYNDGAAVDPEYFATVERELEDIAGGWTLTHGIGGWRGEDTRYREPVRLYAVDAREDIGAALHDLALDVAIALDQEAVYLTAQDISAQLVTPRVRA